MKLLNSFFISFLFLLRILLWAKSENTIPYHVGVILDSSSSMGQMANTCISMGISDFYNKFSSYKTRLILHNKDSEGDPLRALSQAVDLLQNYNVQAIIGPQTSNEAQFLVNLGNKTEVPIISFSATSPFISHAKIPFFIRVANNDNYQVKHIASLIQHFRWREVSLVFEDSTYGHGIVANLVSAFDEIQARVPYKCVISPLATDNEIAIELYKLMTMSTRVYVVHMSFSLAYRVFTKSNELGMMSKGFAWIVTDGITNSLSSINPSLLASAQGVIGVRPYLPHSEKLNDFFSKWKSIFLKGNQSIKVEDLNRYCLWSYDAIWALAISAEKLGIEGSENSTKNSSIGLANLTSIQVSETGSELLKELLNIRFDGVSGPVVLKDGERKPLSYEIINIVGGNIKGLGYRTTDNVVSQSLGISNIEKGLDSFTSLMPIWPGGSLEAPRGWVFPVSGERLRIGVPVTTGFRNLVKMEWEPKLNASVISGFCIDVFQAAANLLPYVIPFEFVPYFNMDGTPGQDYNTLIYQVYLQKFDAVVGDVTITPNRSLYVDFTLPFTERGIAMLVPTLTSQQKSMWIFLQPLTVDLWFVILGFFIATGIIVWAIECRDNKKLKGPVFQQLEKVFSHSVSSLVFAPGENLFRIFSKIVVIMWLFAAFIITSSYTASLSSLLTTRQLLQFPKGGFIGYRSPSFVTNLLNNLNFENTRLKPFKSVDDYADALKKGSRHGGVSAIVDEIPYIKLFLAKYGDRYTMVNVTDYTSGFGFAFPKRSPLVPDFSRAIAQLRESGKLEELRKLWFGPQKNFISKDSPLENNILNFYSFRGLFLIMGITLILAFVIPYFFLNNIPCNQEKEEKDEEREDEKEDWGVVVEELVFPCDNSPLTLTIADNSSDDNLSVKGEGVSVSPSQNHTNDPNHTL